MSYDEPYGATRRSSWGLDNHGADSWKEQGVCAEIDPELWYPEKGGSTKQAKQICLSCPVQELCLQWAMDHDERFGIWGGLSERERRRLRRGEKVVPMRIFPEQAEHGYHGYRKGCKCAVCKAGYAEYHREYQVAQKGGRKHCQVCDAELFGHGRHRYCSPQCRSQAGRRGAA